MTQYLERLATRVMTKMVLAETHQPAQCTICGYYLTIGEEFAGYRCLDPAHWQAAGLLTASDFYPMARLAAQAHLEPDLDTGSHRSSAQR